MRTALASITASPLWAIDDAAYRATLPSTVKRLLARHGSDMNQDKDAAGFVDLVPHYVLPDDSILREALDDFEPGAIEGSVAIVNITGMLVPDCMRFEEVLDGLCSTDRVSALVDRLAADPRITAIVAKGYSPGGMVHGTEKLSNAFRNAAARKPVVALVENMVASAAYWSFCSCTHIMLGGQSAEVGSIGIVWSIEDDRPFWEAMGLKFHDVYDSEATEKNGSIRKLRAGDASAALAEVDALKKVFRAAVTTGRLKVKEASPVFKGALFMGQQAISAGLADSVGDLQAAINLARNLAPKKAAAPPQPAPQPTNMSKFATIWAAALTALGFTEEKKTATADELKKANTELKETGYQLVPAAEADKLATIAALEEKAAKADDLGPKLAAAQAKLTEEVNKVKAALEKNGVKLAEGDDVLTKMASTLEAWGKLPGATHTGAPKAGDDKPAKPELTASQKVAQEAGISMG